MKKLGHACVSIDLDSLWCYHEIHGLAQIDQESVDPIYRIAMPRILSFFSSLDIPLTLFVIGKDIDKNKHFLSQAYEEGHELANHTFSHHYDLRKNTKQDIREDIKRCHDKISTLWEAPLGFRTPGYNISNTILSILSELNYVYDSSVFPCPPYYAAKGAVMGWRKMKGNDSRSSMTKVQTLLSPLQPYRASPKHFWKITLGPTQTPIELPVCVVPGIRLPIIGTSLHLFHSWRFKALYPAIRMAHPELLNLEFHAIDFVDASDLRHPELKKLQPDLAIPWSVKRERYRQIFEHVKRDYKFSRLLDATYDLGILPDGHRKE